MKQLFLIVLFFSSPFTLLSQSDTVIDGKWVGYIGLPGQQLTISLTFNTIYGETDGAINIPQQSSYDMPVEVPLQTADSLVFSFETGNGPGIFRASLGSRTPNQITGLYQQTNMQYPFTINKEDFDKTNLLESHTELDKIIETGTHSIGGSFVIPESYNDSTLIIFVSGSGSQTRNNPVAGFEIFKELSLQLANNGYFSFRYDDRGTGRSTGATDATLQELAYDLVRIASYFADGVNTTPFKTISFLGHSQGGVVSLLASENFSPDKLILLASPTLPGDEIIKQQILYISKEQDIPDEVVQENFEFQQRVYEAARTGRGWDSLEEDVATRLRKQIEELPESQQQTLGNMDQFIQAQVRRQLEGAKTQWFRSFIETDPRSLLSGVQFPVLALFGENDTQVLQGENRNELEEFQNNIKAITISRANHLFQTSNSGLPGEYGLLDHEFTDGFIEEILQFLGANQYN